MKKITKNIDNMQEKKKIRQTRVKIRKNCKKKAVCLLLTTLYN